MNLYEFSAPGFSQYDHKIKRGFYVSSLRLLFAGNERHSLTPFIHQSPVVSEPV